MNPGAWTYRVGPFAHEVAKNRQRREGRFAMNVRDHARTELRQRCEQYRLSLLTLHEQAVYLPISHLTAISVHRDSVDHVEFGSTLFDVPFEAMTPKQAH